MEEIAAGKFKARCLSIVDQVKRTRQPVLITKHGKPVAKLVPADHVGDDIFWIYGRQSKNCGRYRFTD
jgi:prevent-host-death family protein